MTKPRIAFLGLGLMGSGMARRLIAAEFSVAVYNRDRAKAHDFAGLGAEIAASPRAAASGAAVIISMVADDTASRAVWLGPDGALAAAEPEALVIECSTLSIDWIGELADTCQTRGLAFLDAPVTGSRTQAATGELNFLVGGDAAVLNRARPVLTAMSRSIVHLGPVGSGARVKLINNFVCGVQVAAMAEAIALIERCGLERAPSLEILTSGAPGSPLVKTISGRMTAPDYTPHFLARLMAKDLRYAIQIADDCSLELETARAALTQFQRAVAGGHGDKDIAAVVEPLRAENCESAKRGT
jgi:3-hydroxyisobutyrate dehydrogenase